MAGLFASRVSRGHSACLPIQRGEPDGFEECCKRGPACKWPGWDGCTSQAAEKGVTSSCTDGEIEVQSESSHEHVVRVNDAKSRVGIAYSGVWLLCTEVWVPSLLHCSFS